MTPAYDGDLAVGCLFGCGKARVHGSWGLCSGCFGRAKRMVAAGETTRERLAAEGRCLPAGRRPTQWGWTGAKS